jgi:alpha-L-rhamnosidase
MQNQTKLPRGARWIGDRLRSTKGEPPCPYLRRGFRLPGPVVRAALHWTALGVADMFLNGRKVGDAFLMPGWSDFRKRAQMMSADVTKMLRAGDNAMGAILGDGWYSGTLLWQNQRNHYGTHPQLLAWLDIELADGRRMSVATDAAWRLRYGPEILSDIYHGETHDARRDLGDWCTPGAPSVGWRAADVFPAYRGELVPKVNEPVRITQTLRPRKISEPDKGVYVFDFGQNVAGVCRLGLRGRRGQKVTLKFAEMLNADGTVYRENLRLARATDTYICRGRGVEEWTPRFTFHGFRYVEVTGLGGKKPPADLLAALVLQTDMRATGTFRCSNPLLNRLDRNIRWGLRGNFLDVPTDCPQRDERLGWTGDAQVFIGTAAFHYNVRDFFRKWLQDLRDGQRADGAYPDVAPDVLGKYGPQQFGNAAWADAGVICPWQIYQHYGDKEVLAENYEAMKSWIDYQERTSNALIRPRTNYGDWLAIDAVSAPNAPVPCDLVGTAYFAHTTDLMAKIAGLLGHKADAQKFRRLHARIVEAFGRAYVTPDGRVVGHCQTAYLLALAFDLLPARLRPKAFAHLVDLVEARGGHLTTGFVGTPLLLPVLTRFGRTDLAYRILLQEDYPSWLYTVRNGATTMWERWNSYTKEHGFGDVGMNSFNHYAYGAVGEWMYGVIGGIRPLAPGFRKILFAPEPGGGLTSAQTSLETPQGRAVCRWQCHGRTLKVEVIVPPRSAAELRLPGQRAKSLLPGPHRFTAKLEKSS